MFLLEHPHEECMWLCDIRFKSMCVFSVYMLEVVWMVTVHGYVCVSVQLWQWRNWLKADTRQINRGNVGLIWELTGSGNTVNMNEGFPVVIVIDGYQRVAMGWSVGVK